MHRLRLVSVHHSRSASTWRSAHTLSSLSVVQLGRARLYSVENVGTQVRFSSSTLRVSANRVCTRISKLAMVGLTCVGFAYAYWQFIFSVRIGPVVPLAHAISSTNPRVFLDISIDGKPAGKIEMELFSNVCPQTAENFRCLCTGEKGSGNSSGRGPPLWYKATDFHRVVPGFLCQAGSYPNQSIYGLTFADEFQYGVVQHSQPMLLSMANHGANTNGSQFFITLRAAHELDAKNVVFGRVTEGEAVVKSIELVGSVSGEPQATVTIDRCGQLGVGGSRREVSSRR